jgi:hypothetical protein
VSQQPSSSSGPDSRNPWAHSALTWRQRFGYYFIGVAVSLLLMGLYFAAIKPARDQARREMEAQNAGKPLPVPGVPLNPDTGKK